MCKNPKVENKDPIVDNESADEHLAAELAEQEGEGSAIGDSDLEDAGPLLESGTGQRRRQDMPAHGYVMDDFVVDDDEVEMEGEDESSSGSDEEWEEPSVAATAGRTRRAVAAAAAVGSRTSTRTNNSGSTPGHRHSGLLDAFAPGLDEEEEEVYFSAQTGFGRRPTGRRAATVSEAMGTIGLGPLRGEEILPDELRQLQREAGLSGGGGFLSRCDESIYGRNSVDHTPTQRGARVRAPSRNIPVVFKIFLLSVGSSICRRGDIALRLLVVL